MRLRWGVRPRCGAAISVAWRPDAKQILSWSTWIGCILARVAAHDPVKALVHCAHGDDVDMVIIDGVTRVQEGALVDYDVDRLRAGAERFNAKLRQSVSQLIYQGRPLTEFYAPAYPTWQ